MGRAVLDPKGGIEVAYGLDHATGYFLSVTRVSADDSILDLHTGPMGFGKQVDLATILESWIKYGVPEGHIQRAWRGEDVSGSSPRKVDPNSCKVCLKPTTMKCSKCKTVYACSEQHAKQGWKKHKAQCNAFASPQASTESTGRKSAAGIPLKTVKAFLFPVNENSPRTVEVECEAHPEDLEELDPGFDDPIASVRKHMGRPDITFMGHITTSGRIWDVESSTGPVIDIFCGDSCLIDGSPLNLSIQSITNGKAKHSWSGSLLVMKQRDEYGKSQRYVDVDGQTLAAATAYFTNYPFY